MSLFNELKRRNVFRVGLAYLVTAWVIAQVASLVLSSIKAPDWVIQSLLLILGLGFVIALIISWAYELTPEGIKKEKDVTRDDSITNITAKKLDYITLAAAFVVIALFGYQQMNPISTQVSSSVQNADSQNESKDTTTKPVIQTIPNVIETALTLGVAVLPFANLSEDPNNAFFAGGVHEDVLTQLSYIKKLRVISRTSMMKVAELGMEVRDIGKHLGVSHVLEGSVRRAGEQVRVTVQLIDAETDEHVWADSFDRKLDDIFAIQSEIAEKIAAQLKAELMPDEIKQIEQVPTTSNEAYDLFLKARELARVWRGADTFKDMLPLLEKAIELDSDFLKARVMMVEVYGRLVWTGSDPTGEYKIKAKETLDAILAKHPDSIEAASALGNYLYTVERDYAGSLNAMDKVLMAHPNDSEVLLRVASAYKRLNNFTQSLPIIQKAISLDPEHASISIELVTHYEGAGLIEQAYARSNLNVLKFPDDIAAKTQLAHVELCYFGNIVIHTEIMNQLSPQRQVSLFYDNYYEILVTAINVDELVSKLDEFKKTANSFDGAYYDFHAANLLNIVGREQESLERARSALKSFDKDEASIENFIAYRKKGFYADMAYLACMANDHPSFERFESSMNSHKALEISEGGRAHAFAIAECGNIKSAWSMFWKQANADRLGPATPWEMALNPKYQHYFSELPEYQKMVADLKAAKEQRQ